MTVENDCEDQGFSLISDGCPSCHTDEIIVRHGVERFASVALVRVERNGTWYWQCPECLGFYGEA